MFFLYAIVRNNNAFINRKRDFMVMTMRNRIFQIIEQHDRNDKVGTLYDVIMVFIILLSIFPLAIKESGDIWKISDQICVVIFIIDYALRLMTADFKLEEKGIRSFLRYPFTFMAVIDLLTILPSVIPINTSFKILRLLRLSKCLKVFRVFRILRYSKSVDIIVSVIKKTKESLLVVCLFAVGYIFVSALIVFNVEPQSFDDFFDAIYWATVSLTTVGYGDIYPVSDVGRVVTMISSVFGIAVVALPAGIITAGYMTEIQKKQHELTDNNHPDKGEEKNGNEV